MGLFIFGTRNSRPSSFAVRQGAFALLAKVVGTGHRTDALRGPAATVLLETL
jgi:hypothetical protein